MRNVAAEVVAQSRAALTRGEQLRATGDKVRANLADGLATMWADTARYVVLAASVEENAQTARGKASDAGAKAEHERALLDEGVAQEGRLRAQLESLEVRNREKPTRTNSAGSADVDADGSTPKAPKVTPNLVGDGGTR